MMDDDGVCEAFNVELVQVATSAPMVQTTAKALILDAKIIKLVAQFVATQVKKKANEMVSSTEIIVIPSLPPSSGY